MINYQNKKSKVKEANTKRLLLKNYKHHLYNYGRRSLEWKELWWNAHE